MFLYSNCLRSRSEDRHSIGIKCRESTNAVKHVKTFREKLVHCPCRLPLAVFNACGAESTVLEIAVHAEVRLRYEETISSLYRTCLPALFDRTRPTEMQSSCITHRQTDLHSGTSSRYRTQPSQLPSPAPAPSRAQSQPQHSTTTSSRASSP